MTLAPSEIAQFKSLASGYISDAMEMLEIRRSVIVGMRYVAPPGTVMVGTAYTIRQIPKHHPAKTSERLVRHGEVSAERAKEGQVVVIDAGGRTDIAAWGENHTIRCHARGISGVVINGCTRDIAGVARTGLPVFCRGASPVASRWDLETDDLEVPVLVGGVHIRPGDIIFGDEDGIIVIPLGCKDAVLAAACEVADVEARKDPAGQVRR